MAKAYVKLGIREVADAAMTYHVWMYCDMHSVARVRLTEKPVPLSSARMIVRKLLPRMKLAQEAQIK